jgi:protein-tyrosine-phosphatase
MEPKAVDPETIAYLRTKEIDISKATTRSINRVPNLEFTQVLVALTRDARKVFPNPSRAVCLDWTIQDPSKVQGTSQERRKAYDDAFNFLYQHISDICEAVLSDKID